MSIRGVPKAQNSLFKVSVGRRHSVGLGWLRRDRALAVTFLAPGRCVGMRVITNWSRSLNSSRVFLNRDWECVPPCLRMYATAVLLSQQTLTVWCLHWGPHRSRAGRIASSSNQLIWRWESGVDHSPEIWWSFQLAPQPLRDASMKKNRLGSGRCNGTPVITVGRRNQRR